MHILLRPKYCTRDRVAVASGPPGSEQPYDLQPTRTIELATAKTSRLIKALRSKARAQFRPSRQRRLPTDRTPRCDPGGCRRRGESDVQPATDSLEWSHVSKGFRTSAPDGVKNRRGFASAADRSGGVLEQALAACSVRACHCLAAAQVCILCFTSEVWFAQLVGIHSDFVRPG